MLASQDLGKLILRATIAILILFHGFSKLVGGVGFITGLVAKAGLPPAFGYLVYVGEIVAPLLVLAGVWTRAGALVIAINMAVAIFLVHRGEIFHMNDHGGAAIELQAMYFFTAVAVLLLGAGRYSAGGSGGRWN